MASPITRFRRAFALAGLLGVACGTGAAPPVAPRPAATLQPPAAIPSPDVSGRWTLKQTLTSSSQLCGGSYQQVGTSIDYPLWVHRSGTEVSFNYGDIFDGLTLVGSLDGEAFTASTSFAGSRPCRGQRPDYIFESRVAGQFTADGNALRARETSIYRFESGGIEVALFDWAATRPAR